MITDKNLDRIDKALISTRKRLIECVENGQPATVTIEIVLKTGGSVAAALVSVKEHLSMQGQGDGGLSLFAPCSGRAGLSVFEPALVL